MEADTLLVGQPLASLFDEFGTDLPSAVVHGVVREYLARYLTTGDEPSDAILEAVARAARVSLRARLTCAHVTIDAASTNHDVARAPQTRWR